MRGVKREEDDEDEEEDDDVVECMRLLQWCTEDRVVVIIGNNRTTLPISDVLSDFYCGRVVKARMRVRARVVCNKLCTWYMQGNVNR